VFEGGADDIRLVVGARAMVRALRSAGGNVQYTEFKNGTHSIWQKVLGDGAVYDWLLAQRRVAPNDRGVQ
jgi:hypothetical protein